MVILRPVVAAIALSAVSGALAAPGDVESVLTADNRVSNSATHFSSAWTAGATATGATASRTFDQRAPGGRQVSNTINYQVTKYGTLTIGARALMTLPYVAMGYAIWEIYDAVRVRGDDAGGLLHDPGVDPDQFTGWHYRIACEGQPNAGNCAWWASPEGAASQYMLGVPVSYSGPGNDPTRCAQHRAYSHHLSFGTGNSTSAVFNRTGAAWNGSFCALVTGTVEVALYRSQQSSSSCPPSVDPFNPAWSVPGGLPPMADGKCRTARYFHGSITPEQAAQLAADQGSYGQVDYQAILDEALGRGPVQIPAGSVVEVGNTVPAIDGGTETTYNPDGSRTEKKTEYLFQRDPVSLGKGRYTSRFTTTTYGADGNPTGPPTVNEPNPDAPSQDDPCAVDPGRLMCQSMGQVEDPGLQTEDRQVDFSPDTGFGSSSDTCPAPPQLALSFGSVTVDNSILCNWLLYVRALLLTVSGMVAAGIIIGGFRT